MLDADLGDVDLRSGLRQADHLLLLGVLYRAVTKAHSPYPHRTRGHNQEGDSGETLGVNVACLQVSAVAAHAPQAVRRRDVGSGLDHIDVNLQRRLPGRVSTQLL